MFRNKKRKPKSNRHLHSPIYEAKLFVTRCHRRRRCCFCPIVNPSRHFWVLSPISDANFVSFSPLPRCCWLLILFLLGFCPPCHATHSVIASRDLRQSLAASPTDRVLKDSSGLNLQCFQNKRQ